MKRERGSRPILYPLFGVVAGVTQEVTWKEFFFSCSKGNLPKGVTLSGNIITYTHNKNTINYSIAQEPEKASQQLREFFRRHLNVESTTKPSEKASAKPVKTVKSPWKAIKKRHARRSLILRFVDSMTTALNLSQAQKTELAYVIYQAENKRVLDDSIRMKNGLIRAIDCIGFDGEHFYLNCTLPKPEPIRVPRPPDPTFAEYRAVPLDPTAICTAYLLKLKKRLDNSKVRTLDAEEEVEA